MSPKTDTASTWVWAPKDVDRRTVPITATAKQMLAKLKLSADPEIPYVVITSERYQMIQERRAAGTWNAPTRTQPPEVVNNLLRTFKSICEKAGCVAGEFHSLRKSCITNWLEGGVPPHEVQKMAGHASLETTMKCYSRVDKSALTRVRKVSEHYTARVVA